MRRLRDRIDGIDVFRYPQSVAGGLSGYAAEYVGSMLFTWAWFTWARLRGPIDVVHGCNPPDVFWLFGRVAHLWGATYVFDQHDPNPELTLTKFGGDGIGRRFLYRLTVALEKASYRTAAVTLSVNDTCREIALRRGGLAADRVVVVRNVPDTSSLRSWTETVDPVGRGVGYVGVMGSQDGLELLVDAWQLVMAEADLDDVRLDLVGDGPAREPLERRVREDDRLAASVRFHGFQPATTYAPILARCMIGVSPDPPTPFNNLSSMVKVMDYMAIGRGCVVFDLPETRRLGGQGLHVARSANARGLADALIALLRDPAEAGRLGAAARERLDSLRDEWEPFETALLRAYADVGLQRT